MTPTPTPEQVLELVIRYLEADRAWFNEDVGDGTAENRHLCAAFICAEDALRQLDPTHLRHLANHVTSCSAVHSGCALADNPLVLTEQQQELERLRAQVAETEAREAGLRASLTRLQSAAAKMLGGVSYHNALSPDSPGRQQDIAGPVVDELHRAQHAARLLLDRPATAQAGAGGE